MMVSENFEARLVLGVGILLIGFPWFADWLDEPYLVSTASRIWIYALAAMSLNLLVGFAGLVSFGHSAYVGVGAYVVGILAWHQYEETKFLGFPGTLEGFISIPFAMIVSGIVALGIGALCLRTRGIYFIMITLAFAQMLFYFFVSLEQYGGDDGLMMMDGRNKIPGLDLGEDRQMYWLSLVALGLATWFLRRLSMSRFGLVLHALRQNETRLKAIGVPPYPYMLVAFVIAGALAGLSGALLTNHMEFVSPDFLHWTRSGDLLIMVILGGIGTWTGPILGAIVFLLLEEFLPLLFQEIGLYLFSEYWRLVFGPLLICIVLFAKGGLHAMLFKQMKEVDSAFAN